MGDGGRRKLKGAGGAQIGFLIPGVRRESSRGSQPVAFRDSLRVPVFTSEIQGIQKSWGSRLLFGCLVAFWYRLSSSKVVLPRWESLPGEGVKSQSVALPVVSRIRRAEPCVSGCLFSECSKVGQVERPCYAVLLVCMLDFVCDSRGAIEPTDPHRGVCVCVNLWHSEFLES